MKKFKGVKWQKFSLRKRVLIKKGVGQKFIFFRDGGWCIRGGRMTGKRSESVLTWGHCMLHEEEVEVNEKRGRTKGIIEI
jgi:hypothetical protein